MPLRDVQAVLRSLFPARGGRRVLADWLAAQEVEEMWQAAKAADRAVLL